MEEPQQTSIQVPLKHVDLEKAQLRQEEEKEKMREIRKERRLLDQKRKQKVREMEKQLQEEEDKEKEEKEKQKLREKEDRAKKSEQANKEIEARGQQRQQQIEKYNEQTKQIQQQQPKNVQLKNDIMFQELEEKKKKLKVKRNLVSNPQLLSEEQKKQYNYHSQFESENYKNYMQEFKIQKQQHISKKIENNLNQNKLTLLKEKIKNKHQPKLDLLKKEELEKNIEYLEKDQRLARRKMKGVKYEYVQPKSLNTEEVKLMANQYFREAKSKGDKHKQVLKSQLLAHGDQVLLDHHQIAQQKLKDQKIHDLQYLKQAKKMGAKQDYLQNDDLTEEQKRLQVLDDDRRNQQQAQQLEHLIKVNQRQQPLDNRYYLGKKLVNHNYNTNTNTNTNTNNNNNNNNKGNMSLDQQDLLTQSPTPNRYQSVKTQHNERDQKKVDDLYLNSIKAKLKYLKQAQNKANSHQHSQIS